MAFGTKSCCAEMVHPRCKLSIVAVVILTIFMSHDLWVIYSSHILYTSCLFIAVIYYILVIHSKASVSLRLLFSAFSVLEINKCDYSWYSGAASMILFSLHNKTLFKNPLQSYTHRVKMDLDYLRMLIHQYLCQEHVETLNLFFIWCGPVFWVYTASEDVL